MGMKNVHNEGRPLNVPDGLVTQHCHGGGEA